MSSALVSALDIIFLISVDTFSDYQPGAPLKASETTPETNPDDFWHSCETRPVAEFFSLWEDRFHSLEWTVDPFDDEEGMLLRYDNVTDVSSLPSRIPDALGDILIPYVLSHRKYDKSIVTTDGRAIFGGVNVVMPCRNGTEISRIEWRSREIIFLKSIANRQVRMATSVAPMTRTRRGESQLDPAKPMVDIL